MRLTIITGQRSFSSLAAGLLDVTPETENSFENFHCEIGELLLQFFKLSVFFLYLLTRLENEKFAESNQANASLTKPWLITDEAKRSSVV